MENAGKIVNIVLKAVAIGMSIASIVMGFVAEVEIETQVTMLGVGLAALAIASLSEGDTEVDL
jgi:hypothetical protein